MKKTAPPTAPPPKFSPAWALAVFFLGVHLALACAFIRSASPTYDEAVHLASGYSYLATGRYHLNTMDHPPLGEMWAALPLSGWAPNIFTSHPDWRAARVYHYADRFLYSNKIPAQRMLTAARLFVLFSWTLLLGAGLLLWAARLGGPLAAAGAAFAFAFQPVLTSNLSLVTTDGPSAVFFFLTFCLLSLEKRGRFVWLGAGLCMGSALASKFNMILLPPLAAALLVVEHLRRPKPRPAFPWTGVLWAAVAALCALAAVYRFSRFPIYGQGLLETLSRLDQGRSSFLHGAYSITGFPAYFPLALALKTPLALLLPAAGVMLLWGKDLRRERLWVLLPMLVYFLAALTSKVQIGVRHLLPILPFMALLCGWGLAELWRRPWKGRAAAAVLALWAAVSVMRGQPYALAYFNELAGGPAGGWRWFTDSNLDWGQDLPALAQGLKELGDPPIYLSYFGSADPSAYGIRYLPLAFVSNVDRAGDVADPSVSGRVLLAVSVTNLQCTYFADKTLFDWLKRREPLRIFGHTLFLYDLSADLEGRSELARLLTLSGRLDAAQKLRR